MIWRGGIQIVTNDIKTQDENYFSQNIRQNFKNILTKLKLTNSKYNYGPSFAYPKTCRLKEHWGIK